MTKSIVIADDHPLLLDGLYNQLTNLGYTNITKASNGNDAFNLIKELKPEIAILDIEMPFIDGLTIAKECQIYSAGTKFVILSYHKEPEFIVKAKKLNIVGYILKEDAIVEIEICLKNVANNQPYYSKVFQSELVVTIEDKIERIENLSPSELKILKLISQQLSSKDIAEKLFISERTVEKHRSNIIAKLNLTGKPNSLYEWALANKNIF